MSCGFVALTADRQHVYAEINIYTNIEIYTYADIHTPIYTHVAQLVASTADRQHIYADINTYLYTHADIYICRYIYKHRSTCRAACSFNCRQAVCICRYIHIYTHRYIHVQIYNANAHTHGVQRYATAMDRQHVHTDIYV